MKVKNEKAGGKFATGYKYTVLEASFEAGVLKVRFSTPVFEGGYKAGKMQPCINELENGVVLSGYAKKSPEYIGAFGPWLSEAKEVQGDTFPLRDVLRKAGFIWDPASKSWRR